ncbi:dentin sialophosphoprotein [Hermetia illucens]|uniref:dentin sialophosphoprotein n=1 Tax=Hermetia illucens TaxID=343691 RepID=UPI0018CC2D22|nr:dentin sialophosphoprotein [Hermetia illucens]
MDIPETGAIFSLGKSHLVENNQSYFFVKNDPVKRLVSGANQSAVICESGRLFVWGENQFGQLATGDGEPPDGGARIIKKPTCVKTLKALGLKVLDISFGLGWSVILTNSNEIYFAGRNIFPQTSNTYQHFSPVDVATEKFHVTRKVIAIEEFSRVLNGLQLQRVVAGNDYFAVLTTTGRVFAWGHNDKNQIGPYDSTLPEPIEIEVGIPIKKVVCGPESTLILTEENQLYLTGALNDFQYPRPTELNHISPKEEIIDMQISHTNEIYLVTESGNIHKSVESPRTNNLTFSKFYDYDQDENGIVVKLLKGNSFFVALTRAKKLFTTFSESGHHLKTFREISKFKNLRILDFAVGERHVLVLGIPKAPRSVESSYRNLGTATTPAEIFTNGFASTNGDLNENEEYEHEGFRDLSKTRQKNSNQVSTPRDSLNTSTTSLQNNNTHNTFLDQGLEKLGTLTSKSIDFPNSPKLDEPKEFESFEESNSEPTSNINKINSEKSLNGTQSSVSTQATGKNEITQIDMEKPLERAELLPPLDLMTPLKPTQSRQNSARSIRFDESTLIHTKSTDRLNRPQTPYPDPNISPQIRKTSISSTEDDLNQNVTPMLIDSLEHIPEDSPDSPGAQTARRMSLKYSDRGLSTEKLEGITRVISAKTPGERDPKFALLDDSLEQDEEFKVEIAHNTDDNKNEIRFINDGVDVTKTIEEVPDEVDEILSESIKSGTESLEELRKLPKQKNILSVLGEEPIAEVTDGKITKDLKQITQEDILSLNEGDESNDSANTSKDDGKLKISRGEDDERTTASVSSNIVTTNFENDSDNSSDRKECNSPNTIESADPETKKQKVRRFINDLKTKSKEMSCKNEQSVLVEDEPPKYSVTDDNGADQKTSKVCTIL